MGLGNSRRERGRQRRSRRAGSNLTSWRPDHGKWSLGLAAALSPRFSWADIATAPAIEEAATTALAAAITAVGGVGTASAAIVCGQRGRGTDRRCDHIFAGGCDCRRRQGRRQLCLAGDRGWASGSCTSPAAEGMTSKVSHWRRRPLLTSRKGVLSAVGEKLT